MAILVHLIWNKGTPKPEKGRGQTLLKGTDKILNMLKSLSGNLESALHFFSQI